MGRPGVALVQEAAAAAAKGTLSVGGAERRRGRSVLFFAGVLFSFGGLTEKILVLLQAFLEGMM